MLTGDGGVPQAVEAIWAGAFDFLQKPCDFNMLIQRIQQAIRYSHAMQTADEMTGVANQMESIFNASHDMIFLTDNDMRVLRCNRSASDWLGRRQDEIVGHDLHDLLVQKPAEMNTDVFAEQDCLAALLRDMEQLDNNFYEITSASVDGDNGSSPGKLITIRDVTEQRRNEKATKEQMHFLQELLDSIPNPVFFKDQQESFSGCNTAFEKMFQTDRKQLNERLSIPPFLQQGYEIISWGDQELLEKQGIQQYESTLNLPDNSHRQILISKASLTRTDGSIGGLVGVILDVTELRKTEDSLHRLAAAIEQIPEGIVITGSDGLIQYVNPSFSEITGYSFNEIQGRNPKILNSGKHNEKMYQDLWETIQSGRVWSGRMMNRRKDGKIYQEDMTITPVRDSTNKIAHYVAIKRDVTQEVAMEAELRQAQKLESIGQLAAGIAHEINTPTQYVGDTISFFAEAFEDMRVLLEKFHMMLKGLKENKVEEDLLREIENMIEEADLDFLCEEIPRGIKRTEDGVHQIATIVRAMKEFSHPGVQEKTPTDINRSIKNVVTVARNEWKYNAEVKLDLDDTLPLVPCLPGELNQAVLNLVINAAHAIGDKGVDASGEKGLIYIQTRQAGNQVEICISDTGCGIPDEILDRIFDPFFTTKEIGRGTGQGLSIARNVIVEKHNGTLSVDTTPGEGTKFTIILPLGE
jgi:PAS domain S-box-containing protein